MRAHRHTLGLLIAAAALLVPAGALASGNNYPPVPGATYTGSIGDGTISITVSSDGTMVTAYSFAGVNGVNGKGGCIMGGQGQTPAWGGAPISGGSFDYSSPPSFDLSGSFNGAQSVQGDLTIGVAGSSSDDGCSTTSKVDGKTVDYIQWTATTTSPAPPSGGSGSSGAGGGQGSTGVGKSGVSKRKSLVVRISLKRRSTWKLAGNLKSSNRTCVSRRNVVLWRGSKRVGSGRSTVKGAFTFRATKPLHNKPVRATVKAMSNSKLACAAASSTFIRG
jgi:hypothetical protein